ncbi:hypothetical protein OROMI_033201 [Orobanche minor]
MLICCEIKSRKLGIVVASIKIAIVFSSYNCCFRAMHTIAVMDPNYSENEWLVARVRQLESERNELHKDIEQLCMHQAGPAYLGVAARMHFQRTAGLEQEIESLKKKLATCTRENHNLREELSEAYLIKSQLADLHSAEVSKNVEGEKQLKFFQGCVAAAFAERDNAILEAEKAKEKVELMPQELSKSQIRMMHQLATVRHAFKFLVIEELNNQLFEEKGLTTSLRIELEKHKKQNEIFEEVVDKFYHIRQCTVENFTEPSWEKKCECLLHDSDEVWRFRDDEDTSTSNYINSLEGEINNLRKHVDNLQNKLLMGLEIETHLKKKIRDFEKKEILAAERIKEQISALHQHHYWYRNEIANLLNEGYSELNSVNNAVVEKMRQLRPNRENILETYLTREEELHDSECKDVHISHDSDAASISKSNDPGLPTTNSSAPENREALALALHEKVEVLLLLSQQEERHLLERNVNSALQKKVEELRRNLLQVTNEKVKALMELAQLKQEQYTLQEKSSQEKIQVKQSGETGERKTAQEKDGKLKNLLKRNYLTRWVGGSDGSDADVYEQPKHHMDFARMKIEIATLKEILGSMEHLLSSVRRLRMALFKVKDSSVESSEDTSCIDQIITEANLVRTAVGGSLPVSWSNETYLSYDINDDSAGFDKLDFVSAAGFEMVELVIFAAQVLKDQKSRNSKEDKDMVTERPSPE